MHGKNARCCPRPSGADSACRYPRGAHGWTCGLSLSERGSTCLSKRHRWCDADHYFLVTRIAVRLWGWHLDILEVPQGVLSTSLLLGNSQ